MGHIETVQFFGGTTRVSIPCTTECLNHTYLLCAHPAEWPSRKRIRYLDYFRKDACFQYRDMSCKMHM